jgi:TonB family protein
MRRGLQTLRYFRLSAVLIVAFGIAPPHLRAANEVEQHLRDLYAGKTLVLRNFYQGERLDFDSAGLSVSGFAVPGDWTLDGFVRVTSVGLSGQHLTIQADRLFLDSNGQAFEFRQSEGKNKEKKAKKESRLRIEVELDPGGISSDKADAALSGVFLTARDRIADLVPDYWKPCVLAASTGKNKSKYSACSFPQEFAAIPGLVYSLDESPESAGAGDVRQSDGPVVRIGRGVTAPRVIHQTEPAFSDQAREAKYQGVVVVSLIVDKTGRPRNIRIVRPLGLGLDQKAVETISTWQFDPAKKDGEPVDVVINVEVNFHLY